MDYEAIDTLRERHVAWRLLRSGNAVLTLSFLGRFFVQDNRGAASASVVADALDEELYARNVESRETDESPRFPKSPRAYLEDWAATESGYLRR